MTIYVIVLHIEGAVYAAAQGFRSMEAAEGYLKTRLIDALGRRCIEDLDGLSLERLQDFDPLIWGDIQPVFIEW